MEKRLSICAKTKMTMWTHSRVRSIKIYGTLLGVPCPTRLSISLGEPTENVTVKYLTKHTAHVFHKFHIHFYQSFFGHRRFAIHKFCSLKKIKINRNKSQLNVLNELSRLIEDRSIWLNFEFSVFIVIGRILLVLHIPLVYSMSLDGQVHIKHEQPQVHSPD